MILISSISFFVLELSLTFIACLILGYVSMAISVGPWISPIIILCCNIFLFKSGLLKNYFFNNKAELLCKLQLAPSLAGLVCTAIGFMLPTLYFLNKESFLFLVNNSLSFYILIFIIILLACFFGTLVTLIFYDDFSSDKNLKFPVPTLIASISTNTSDSSESMFLKGGVFSIIALGIKSLFFRYSIIPKTLFFFPSLVAIGFEAGKKILVPLLVGFLLKFLILPFIHNFAGTFCNLESLSSDFQAFTFTVSSGIIIFDLIGSGAKSIFQVFFNFIFFFKTSLLEQKVDIKKLSFSFDKIELKLLFLLLNIICFLFSLKYFSWKASICLLVAIVFVLREALKLAATIGLVPFGRFATIIMVPALLLFKLDSFELVVLCLFASVSIAAAASFMFNKKVGEILKIENSFILKSQFRAILITAVFAGIVFLFLFNSLELGTPALFAQRGQSRAMLAQAFNLNIPSLIVGLICLLFLRFFKISEMLVFSALIMPIQMSLSMLLGAVVAVFCDKTKESDFFFAGIFSGESLFVIISLFF